MYFLYSLGGVTFNKCWITLSILNCYSPNFEGFILMKNALNNQVGMLGDMFLWLVANLKQGVIYFIKQGGGNHKIAWVYLKNQLLQYDVTRPLYNASSLVLIGITKTCSQLNQILIGLHMKNRFQLVTQRVGNN